MSLGEKTLISLHIRGTVGFSFLYFPRGKRLGIY